MIVLPDIVQVVLQLLKEDEHCYLVGGAVRDLILGREIQDFDFSSKADPRSLARKVADRLGGVFYVMDEARLTSRVILQQRGDTSLVMDFSLLQGTLEEDLQSRDFTINAMAIDIRAQGSIIDPLKGGRDLQERWLRLCNPSSLEDDPVRVIRAVRYASELNLKIETQTKKLISQASSKLNQVSLERKRDELFKILDKQNSYKAIYLLQKLGLLGRLGSEPSPERMDQYKTFELFQKMLCPVGKITGAEFFTAATFLSSINSTKKKLSLFMAERNSNRHTRFQLDKFALLTSRELVEHASGQLLLDVFSNEEIKLIQQLQSCEDSINQLLIRTEEIDNRDVYRYYRLVGDSGVDLLLLALAKEASKPAAELKQDLWLQILVRSAIVLDIWFEHPEIIRPRPLMNGNELMTELELQPGPLIGQLLEALKEEQAAGVINNSEKALIWLRQKINP